MKKIINILPVFVILAVISFGLMIYTGFNFNMISMNRYLLLFAIFGAAIALLIACFTTKKDLEETKIGVMVSLVLILWLFLAFGGMIFAGVVKSVAMVLILFSQFIIMLGAILIKNSKYGWIYISIGSIISILLAIHNSISFEQQIFMVKILIPLLLMAIFPIIGTIMMINTLLYRKTMLQKCTLKTEGTCIELRMMIREGIGKGITVYSPIYEYYIDGQKYIYDNYPYSNISVPKIGDKEILYINPDNFNEAYRKHPIAIMIVNVVLWFSFIVLGGGGLVIAIKELLF